MKKQRHKWESIPQDPVDLESALKGPALRWREKCAKCGAMKGARRDVAATIRSGRASNFSIVWRDVYGTPRGGVLSKMPECLQPENPAP